MKCFLAILTSAFISLNFVGCSDGNNFTPKDSFSIKVIEAISAIDSVKKSNSMPCPRTLEFENIPLEKKCWNLVAEESLWKVCNLKEDKSAVAECLKASLNRSLKVTIDLGNVIRNLDEIKFSAIDKHKSGNFSKVTFRELTEKECFYYLVQIFDTSENPDIKFGVGISKKPFCKKLSKPYPNL